MKQYGIDRRKLEAARGKLITALRRDVSWQEFASMTGVAVGTLHNIRHGRTNGSAAVNRKIFAALQEQGVRIRQDEMLSPVGQPNSDANREISSVS